jgi:hypothetical protein
LRVHIEIILMEISSLATLIASNLIIVATNLEFELRQRGKIALQLIDVNLSCDQCHSSLSLIFLHCSSLEEFIGFKRL